MYGDYNPYSMMNPYLTQPLQQPKQEVVKVNGENGARALALGPNSSALALDESGLLVWLIVTDGAGYKTVAPYDITPHQAAPAPDYTTLESRIKRLEEAIYVNTADLAATGRNEKPGAPEYRTDKKTYERREERSGSYGSSAADASTK